MMLWKRNTLCAAIAALSLAVSAQDQSSTKQGLSAFEAGDYSQALEHFEQAEAAGDGDQSTDYNIAVSLYRLGRLNEAEARFLELVDVPRWQILVRYNLGLVYEAKGETDKARQYFTLSAQQQEQERVQQLANNKLSSLANETAITDEVQMNSAQKKWAALVDMTGGVDSNASTLADDVLEKSDRGEDSFTQALLYSHYYLAGQRGDGLRLHGLAFGKQFSELDFLDSTVVGGGLTWEHPLWGWQSEVGVTALSTSLDGDKVADQLQLRGAVWKRFQPGTFRIGMNYSDFRAGDRFSQIEGEQARLELTWGKRFAKAVTSVRYRHEWNNRDDLMRNGGFASYSPVRNGLRGRMDWHHTDKWRTRLEAEFIASDFPDINVLRDIDGSVKRAARENRRLRLGVGVAYQFADHWLTELEYRHEDVNDEFDLYTYDKDLIQASLQYEF